MSAFESFACPGCNAGLSWHEGTTDGGGYWLCPSCDAAYTDESKLKKYVVDSDKEGKGKA